MTSQKGQDCHRVSRPPGFPTITNAVINPMGGFQADAGAASKLNFADTESQREIRSR
jgi:hypothetical protein